MLIQANAIVEVMQAHQWVFPAVECVHIACFALAIGTIALVDFSLLGVGLPGKAAPELVRRTELWTITGLVFIFFSGMLLFATDPDQYYLNRAFQFKMICLVLAVTYNYTLHRKIALSEDRSAGASKLAAVVSLMLWVAIVFGGLFFAFT